MNIGNKYIKHCFNPFLWERVVVLGFRIYGLGIRVYIGIQRKGRGMRVQGLGSWVRV